MAVDIGPKIGIDGEKEFRQELNNLAQQMRTLGSEMKAVTSAFDANDKSQESLAAQTDVLNRQIATQQQRLTQLQRGLDESAKKFGENDTRTLKWAQAVNNATADLNNLRTQLNRTEGEMDDVADATDDMADAMDDAGRQSQGFGQMLAGAFTGTSLSNLVQSVVDGVQQIIESTQEYRRIMASLESSSQRAGYSAAETTATYEQLFGVLGDEQTAATTTANLQALGLEQEQLTQLTDAAIGAWATYGDSIPIDGLSEAINETIRVGQVTGTFADALNWAGTSEDEFNQRLAEAGSEAERANLVLQELADQGLVAAGEGWRQNNQDLVDANLASANLMETMAGFAEILTPIVTLVKTGLNEILQSVLGVAQAFQSGGISGGVEALGDLASEAVSTIRAQAPQMLQAGYDLIGDLVDGIVSALPDVIEGLGDLLAGVYDFMAENGPGFIEQGYAIIGDLATGIIDAIPDLVAQLPELITAFIGYITSVLPEIAKQGAILLGRLALGIVQAVPDLIKELPAVGESILEGLGDALSGVAEIGKDLIRGLWEGIKDMGSWIGEKIQSFGQGVLDDIKDFFGIESPSKVFREEVGVMLGRGVALGLEDSLPLVADAAERVGSAIEAKIQETEAALEAAGTESAEAVLEAQLDALESFYDEYTDAMEDLADEQQDMIERLFGYGDLFERTKTELGEVLTVNDLEDQIDAINRYGAALEALKARGVSESLLDEIVDLDVEDATDYTEALLKMTDEEYGRYLALWEAKQQVAENVARQFYAQELGALQDEFVDKLPDSLDGIRDQMTDLGRNAAINLADGFQSQYAVVRDAFSSTMQRAMSAASGAVSQMTQTVSTPTVEELQSSAAGIVNGLSTVAAGQITRVEIPLIVNGREFSRAILDDLRAVQKANPEVAMA